jgi:NDP-sugar pyrophosphorylase family protein
MLETKRVQVAILAGGLGTRLRPYTETVPKPMIDINGKPFLEIQLNYLKTQGFKDILLCTGYLGNVIEEHFGDGKDFGLNISYSNEKSPLGTAGAIKNAEHLVKTDPFVLMNGDSYWEINFADLLNSHWKYNFPLTMAVCKSTNPAEQELIEVKDGVISSFYKRGTPEHKKHIQETESPLINSGIYVLSKKILGLIPEERFCSLENEIFPHFKKAAAGFFWEGYIKDLATRQFCNELEKYLLGVKK